jgi:hypothetical protein
VPASAGAAAAVERKTAKTERRIKVLQAAAALGPAPSASLTDHNPLRMKSRLDRDRGDDRVPSRL